MAEANSTRELPPNVFLCRKSNCYRAEVQVTINGKRIRKTKLLPRGTTTEEAAAIAEEIKRGITGEVVRVAPECGWTKKVDSAFSRAGSWLHRLHKDAIGRAKKSKKPCSLTLDELARLLKRSNGRCEVSGVPFSEGTIGVRNTRPFAPSLDRIDPRIGYTFDNCRITCIAINIAMFDWGQGVVHTLAFSYVAWQTSPHAKITLHPIINVTT